MNQHYSKQILILLVFIINTTLLDTLAMAATSDLNKNLVQNSGFETGDRITWQGRDGRLNSKYRHSGRISLNLKGDLNRYLTVYQNITVASGKKYSFSGWITVKGKSKGNYGFRVSWFDASKQEIRTARHFFGITRSNAAFKKHATTLVAPTNASTARIYLFANKANGNAYFDNISVNNLNSTKSMVNDTINTTRKETPTTTSTRLATKKATTLQKQPASRNLLENSGFEFGKSKNWRGAGRLNKTYTQSGGYALSLEGSPARYITATQTISTNPETKYQFSGWLKVMGKSKGNYGLRVSWLDANSKEIRKARQFFGITRSNSTYKYHSIQLIAPANAAKVKIYLFANRANGTAYFDDIAINNLTTKIPQRSLTKDSPTKSPKPSPSRSTLGIIQKSTVTPTLTANKDSFIISQNKSISINILSNDAGLTSGTIVSIKSKPTNGRIKITTNKQTTYTPNADFFGNDSFIYQLTNTNGDISIATVSISIECNKNCKKTFHLTWLPSKSPDIIAYKVHVGKNKNRLDQVYQVKNTHQFAYLANARGSYFFAVKAVNRNKIESDYSSIVSATF